MNKLEIFEVKYGFVNKIVDGNLQYNRGDRSFLDGLLGSMYIDSKLLKVLEFAIVAHGNQTRKDSDVPYWVHVATVAVNAYNKALTEDKNIAFSIGCLHDVVEDCFFQNGRPYKSVDIYEFMKPIFDKQFDKDVLVGVDNLTEKYTSTDYPFLNRKERKALELKKYATIRFVDAIVKQEDIRDNFCGDSGYYFQSGPFPKKWALEAIQKIEILKPILVDKFDSNLFDVMNRFVEGFNVK
jgi:guanosine-3',5'-bis(diphosphate) 3'-pyrophosphohydrolase